MEMYTKLSKKHAQHVVYKKMIMNGTKHLMKLGDSFPATTFVYNYASIL